MLYIYIYGPVCVFIFFMEKGRKKMKIVPNLSTSRFSSIKFQLPVSHLCSSIVVASVVVFIVVGIAIIIIRPALLLLLEYVHKISVIYVIKMNGIPKTPIKKWKLILHLLKHGSIISSVYFGLQTAQRAPMSVNFPP